MPFAKVTNKLTRARRAWGIGFILFKIAVFNQGRRSGVKTDESGTAICRAVVEAATAQGDDDRRVAWGERTCDGGAGVSGVEMVSVGGESPKRQLMQRFRQAIEPGKQACVLVATASFWEGFDVPGDALQAVIIDKLPFPPPNDPVVEARGQRLEAQGRSSFNDYFLPEAAVSLKQGAGRLIRRESDHGALVICDNRLVSTGYGRRLLGNLPPMQRVQTLPELIDALSAITKTYTNA